MAFNYSQELEELLQRYIDEQGSGERIKPQLRPLLQRVSAEFRHRQFMEIRGVKRGSYMMTVMHEAIRTNDCETLRWMMEGWTSKQIFTATIVRDNNGSTALHNAAYFGQTPIVRLLLERLTWDQRFSLVQSKDGYGETVLHRAVAGISKDTSQLIYASLEPDQQAKILLEKNRNGQCVKDLEHYQDCLPPQVCNQCSAKLETESKRLMAVMNQKLTALQQNNSQQLQAALQQQQACFEKTLMMREKEMQERVEELQTDNYKRAQELIQKVKELQKENCQNSQVLVNRLIEFENKIQHEKTQTNQKLTSEQMFQKHLKDLAEQERVTTKKSGLLEADLLKWQNMVTQRVRDIEKEMSRIGQKLNQLAIYLRTPQDCDASGDQEVEDYH
ncbi:zinc finger protein 853-like isoform X2 [Watersipora subatra]|uniref:zinc finger protein 853-like isoform X2 n=1 Tax=Watersipora subatra TaxID=2589382 RepID=UPI00355AD2B1